MVSLQVRVFFLFDVADDELIVKTVEGKQVWLETKKELEYYSKDSCLFFSFCDDLFEKTI